MYILITRTWNESWYACFDDKEKAQAAFDYSSGWHPNCWLIEGKVLDCKTYSDIGKDNLPY